MSVYVSPFRALDRVFYLFGDTDEETHALAMTLGLKRSWATKRTPVTYELTGFGRHKAVEAGAIELNPQEFQSAVSRLLRQETQS